jgi:hypothetical protein
VFLFAFNSFSVVREAFSRAYANRKVSKKIPTGKKISGNTNCLRWVLRSSPNHFDRMLRSATFRIH